ncbi:MAG: FGGY family carbohydrate kinase [Oscillospiraceae bacterium]|nr:FGGY family carbohydrate kinase [Oscillospiraceae bacterium]
MSLGGLDIGTSGCKCTIFDRSGRELASAYQAYASKRNMGLHEADMDAIWQSVKYVIAKSVRDAGSGNGNVKVTGIAAGKGAAGSEGVVIGNGAADSAGKVATGKGANGTERKAGKGAAEPLEAICVSSFGETCAVLDKHDMQAIPAFLYTDSRGVVESRRLGEKLGDKRVFDICGHRPGYMYTLPKLMWAREHLPNESKRIHRILPINSAIIYFLTGEAVSEPSLASRTMMFDIRSREWSEELLEEAGVDGACMPRVIDIGSVAGTVAQKAAEELGLPSGVRIVAGPQDQIVAALGAGALNAGLAVNGSGSVECITPLFSDLPAGDSFYNGNYCVVPMLPGLFVSYAFIFTGGSLLEWFCGTMNACGPDEFNAAQVKQPTGIFVLPHFSGAATPYMDSNSKGVILGLTLEHGAADMYRATQEGLCYESLLNIHNLSESGIVFDSLKVTGGGARSAVWTQMKADVYGVPCQTLKNREAGATGSAMLAGVATGAYSDLREAADLLITEGETFYPRPEMTEKYLEQYERYKKLYAAARSILNE